MNFEDLLSMSLDESEAFLEDLMTSENHLIQTPNYLKEEITTKCYKAFICVKRMQLFTYSVKVCAAVAFALILLFSISPTDFTYPYDSANQEWKESYMQDSIEQDKKESSSWISGMKDSLLDKGFSNAEKSQESAQDIIVDDREEIALGDLGNHNPSTPSKDLEDIAYESNEGCKTIKSKIQLLMEKIQKWFQNRKYEENKRNNQY